ncbi:putative transcriptional regulator [Clostridium pascui]|uniref:hypothetical protein n=1 Tax=Clostridium pascui TaxID=46609 RepID=UPI00195A9BCB|nr:hypothetical protein [Clostridium pascui]MBM7869242.1 putative transcriptional regulator [Clostridium pascui]
MLLSERNEEVKNKLDKYIKKFGVKKVFIAKEIGLSPTSVGLFIKGQRELQSGYLDALEELMEEKM